MPRWVDWSQFVCPFTPERRFQFEGQSPPSPPPTPKDDTWARELLEGVVWVLLDGSGEAVRADEDDEGFWWPAQVKSEPWSHPIVVHLLPIRHVHQTLLQLHRPSSSNILTFVDSRTAQPRFNDRTFRVHDRTRELHGRQHPDLADFKAALERATTLNAEDHLPDVEEILRLSSRHPSVSGIEISSQRRQATTAAAEVGDDHPQAAWCDPGPDSLLEIPGELVIARSYKAYYAAMVYDYKPGVFMNGRARPGQYLIEFMDGKRRWMSRKMFYSRDDDEFVTKPLGHYEDEDDSDADADVEVHVDTARPITAAPTDRATAESMALEKLIPHIYNILHWTVKSAYPPTRGRCDDFYRGARKRKALGADGTQTGSLTASERGVVSKAMQTWVACDLRPVGDARYEELSPIDRAMFCCDILVPEAAKQLLAWRAGYRVDQASVPPCPEGPAELSAALQQQETAIHKKADHLARLPPPANWAKKINAVRTSRSAAMRELGRLA
ncbi:hypothetical protein CALVIDRAFT_568722 [Calocera viscosa TUFC12733]|uniref:PWWP domain-containing protein n=1 Tax=Calocera viscosa (strain TUFC12733) TaxID=1330018 RepID=A0A167GRZ8_CALVF|nr:hypothetical protein CALVIDRAFT_568722 [Calocera viscosa TUFC12733]